MRFFKLVAASFFVVASLGTLAHAQSGANPMKWSISTGGVYMSSNLGYSYYESESYLEETAELTDDVAKKGFGGFSLGAGYFVFPRIEVFGAMSYAKASGLGGEVWISIPSEYFFNEIATDTATQGRSASHLDVLVGAKYHFAPHAKIAPYLGLGLCFASASLQMVSYLSFADQYDEFYYHTVEITEVDLQEVKANALGGFVLGGLEVGIGSRLGIFADAQYKFAKKSVAHPFGSMVSLDMSGFVGTLGLRIHFGLR